VCVQHVRKYQNTEYKWYRYFVNDVETQLREKPLWGSQTQGFHYSEDKAVTKQLHSHTPDAVVVPWTLTHNPMRTPLNQVTYLKGSSMESFTLGLFPKINFNMGIATALRQWLESKLISTITPKLYSLSSKELNTEFLQITCLEASIYRL
jgi:hypothetical protein